MSAIAIANVITSVHEGCHKSSGTFGIRSILTEAKITDINRYLFILNNYTK